MNDPFSDKYEFTEEEIEEIKKEYNTDLSEFTREEVEKWVICLNESRL